MKQQEFGTWVEIPITVFFTRQRYIPTSRHQEGQAAAIGIDDVQIADDIKEWILEKYNQQFIDEAWENIEEAP